MIKRNKVCNSARLRLAGVDDPLSRGSYAQRDIPGDLVQYLDGNARDECLSILQRFTLWQYSSDSPYARRTMHSSPAASTAFKPPRREYIPKTPNLGTAGVFARAEIHHSGGPVPRNLASQVNECPVRVKLAGFVGDLGITSLDVRERDGEAQYR